MSEKIPRLERSFVLRLLSIAALAPPVVLAVLAGGWVYHALIGVMSLILVYEWAQMVKMRPLWVLGGIIYFAASYGALWFLRADPEVGNVAVFWLLAVVWGADTGGYVFGLSFGGPKLAPRISPNKTWAGFAGGVVTSALAGWAVVSFATGTWAGVGSAAFAMLVSVVSQMGDLLESLCKRRFGIKDSGQIIPGHGGLFDRVDGLLAASLVLAALNFGLKDSVLSWLS